MTNNYKSTDLYKTLVDKLNQLYKKKNNIEDFDDYLLIYNKSMAFVVECYDTHKDEGDGFYAQSGLYYVELSDYATTAYNDEFALDAFIIQDEQDIDDFLLEFTELVKTCDADKRCTKILKTLEKLSESLDGNPSDVAFFAESIESFFDLTVY